MVEMGSIVENSAVTAKNIYLNESDGASEYFQDVPPNSFAPGADHKTLDIAIIGAGIAGLAAAIALGQSGHNVEVCLTGSRAPTFS